MHFDVFNGDADGIISLLQLRLAEPKDSVLITGVKREISLLHRVDVESAGSVTVLDISMEKNREGLDALLQGGVPVTYFDHHRSGEIPDHPKLTAFINPDADVCTALLVNHQLKNRYPEWAIAAAFGDNLHAVAHKRAEQLSMGHNLTMHLEQLGTCINYNGYGRTVDDLHYAPEELFQRLLPYESPVDLICDSSSLYYLLWEAYRQDIAKAEQAKVLHNDEHCMVVALPDERWANRVSGVYGNQLANKAPGRAHAVLTRNADGMSYTVSIRAPLDNKQGAGDLCAQFPTGGGRAAAAGINRLEETQLGELIAAMQTRWG